MTCNAYALLLQCFFYFHFIGKARIVKNLAFVVVGVDFAVVN